MTDKKNEKLLMARGIKKSFGQNYVLQGVDIDLDYGEVLALIGGNGAGKSTLMKIIMGIYQSDEGQIYVNGKFAHITKTAHAIAEGIYMVPQEPMLFPNMTVEENITMGFKGKASELRNRIKLEMDGIGWVLDLNRKANSLSIAEQALVEIIRGLLRKAKILIFDEPTSALTFDEVENFFKVVKDLRRRGVGIIYITHRLAEVFEIATHVAIMRDGAIKLNGKVSNFNREMLVKGLLPSDLKQEKEQNNVLKPLDYKNLKPIFELVNFSGHGFNNISLKVYPGEILGIAGVVGAGRTELVSTIFGRDQVLGGRMILDGRDITRSSTREVIKAFINYVPEDRYNHGLFEISSVSANITSAMLGENQLGRFFLNQSSEFITTQKYIKDFSIRVTDLDQLVESLSGGNQQKVVLGRALSTKPKLIIMDEPTRGIDAIARIDVYNIVNQLRNQGIGILLVSSDIEEIIELSDRAITMFHGSINGEFSGDEIVMENLTKASFGLHN